MDTNQIVLEVDIAPVPLPIVRKIAAGQLLQQSAKVSEVVDQQSETLANTIRQNLRIVSSVVEKKRLDISREKYETPKKAFKSAVDEKIKQELSDCLLSILIIADELKIDMENEFIKTIEHLQEKINGRKILRNKKGHGK